MLDVYTHAVIHYSTTGKSISKLIEYFQVVEFCFFNFIIFFVLRNLLYIYKSVTTSSKCNH